jgi:hypothetical protein
VRRGKQHYYRKVGNMNKKRFYSDPAFKNAELASREFGAAAKLSATIRKAMEIPAKALGDAKLHSRFTKAIQESFRRSDGQRGKRDLRLGDNLRNLEDFTFKKHRHTLEKFAEYRVTPQPMHQQPLVTCRFHNWGMHDLPNYADHIRFNLHLVALSDLHLAKKSSKKWHYVPSHNLHGTHKTIHGAWLPFRDRSVPKEALQHAWSPYQLMPEAVVAGCTILVALSIEICAYDPESGTELYHKQLALKIIFSGGTELGVWQQYLKEAYHLPFSSPLPACVGQVVWELSDEQAPVCLSGGP